MKVTDLKLKHYYYVARYKCWYSPLVVQDSSRGHIHGYISEALYIPYVNSPIQKQGISNEQFWDDDVKEVSREEFLKHTTEGSRRVYEPVLEVLTSDNYSIY